MKNNKVRIQKILSNQQRLSRRKAEQAIRDKQVKVNGEFAHLGQLADPDIDDIWVDPSILNKPKTTIAFYKPRGIVTNCPQSGQTCIRDILPPHLTHLSSIGRLDKESEGLIILTDDGLLANHYLNAGVDHIRVYDVWLNKPLSESSRNRLQRGIPLLGGRTKPMTIEPISTTVSRWTLTEGKNRQIRRMAMDVGCYVTRLKRIQFGPILLDNLKSGKYRDITEYLQIK